jgi:hypothetical protein
LTGTGGATPLLNSVTLAYLPQNSPPVVKSISVISQASLISTVSKPSSASSSSAAYSVTVSGSDSTDTSSTSAGTPTQTLTRAASQQVTVSWQAEDPDGDRLVYSLYFRSEDETQWLLLRAGTHDTSMTFDADILADGKYYFRVTASDREANPAASAREAQLISTPVMIDNTPPAIAMGTVQYSGGTAHVEWSAADASSALRRCEYSLDAGDWVPMESADGVIDSPREKFTLDLPKLSAGEHLLVIRVADSANNTATARVILK